jgi:hypothetical protein
VSDPLRLRDLDWDYVARWAARWEVTELLDELQREAAH